MTVCHNSQSASWQSDSGLVMYFSTLPTPSSSVPCILKRQHLLKPTSNSALSPQNPCTTQINASPLQQHTYPASRKNSALRVSFFMDMTLQYYNQPHITVEEQIQFLRSEGLSFEYESRAKHLLNHISMFRLKSYLKHLDNIIADVLSLELHLNKHILFINSIPSFARWFVRSWKRLRFPSGLNYHSPWLVMLAFFGLLTWQIFVMQIATPPCCVIFKMNSIAVMTMQSYNSEVPMPTHFLPHG